eukprot:12353749-Heterocapsa_arctica.AAC.1
MMLEVMKGVHDKAPVRKKEDRQKTTEASQRCFYRPRTGLHGARNFEAREGGGWNCGSCKKYTTTHVGWRRT